MNTHAEDDEPIHDSVLGHVRAGRITPKKRTTRDMLELAATILEHYEGEISDSADILTEVATVAVYLRREADKRS